jgi:separase
MKGMVALIGKLIAHGLDTLALKELRILKRCLEQQPSHPASSHPSQERDTHATLLLVELQTPSKDLLALLVQHQALLLKLAATSSRPSVIESIVEGLDPQSPLSPSAIVLECLKYGEQEDKTVKQLESLVRSLLSLCPSSAASADTTAINPNLYPSPEAVLTIHIFALIIQKLWWPLARHSADVEKELARRRRSTNWRAPSSAACCL